MKNKKTLLLLLIISIAVFFRVWNLNSTPPGLYPDIAMNGINALEAIETGNYKVFYKENNGREGLFMNLIAFSFQIFGVHLWSLRIVGALIGILTVVGIYFLTKKVVKTQDFASLPSTHISLLTAFFTAISFWHVNFSRIGFRAILVPFAIVWCFYFLLKWWNNLESQKSKVKSQNYLAYRQAGNLKFKIFFYVLPILAGIFFGLGFHTYIAFRFVPFIVIILAFSQLAYLIKNKYYKNIARWFTGYIVFSVAALLVMLPLILYFYQNPEDIMGRAAQVSIFEQPKPLIALGESLIKTAGMLNIYGDPNWRHNYSGSPLLSWPVGIFFLVGLVVSFKKFPISLSRRQAGNFPASPAGRQFPNKSEIQNSKFKISITNILLLSWFILILAPSYLTTEGLPHSLRSIGAIPPVMIWSGIGAWWLYDKIKLRITNYELRITNRQLQAFCFIILALIALHEFKKYFYDWGQNQEVRNSFSQNLVDVGYFVKNFNPSAIIYVIVNEGGSLVEDVPVSAQTVKFVYAMDQGPNIKPKVNYIVPEKISDLEIIIGIETIVVPEHYDENIFEELQTRFRSGIIVNEQGITYFKI